MNIKDRMLSLNFENTAQDMDINDLFLTVITKFQLFEPCIYLSEDDDWLNVAVISVENEDISQPFSIRKSEITTFGIFNCDQLDVPFTHQKGSQSLYQ